MWLVPGVAREVAVHHLALDDHLVTAFPGDATAADFHGLAVGLPRSPPGHETAFGTHGRRATF